VLTSAGAFVDTFGGGQQYSDGDATADPTGTVAMGTDGANVFALHTDTAGDLQVDVLTSALPTGASTLAEQQSQTTALQIMDDWDESDRAKVNLIVGQAGIAAGTGTDGATVPRVTLATNVGLPAGTNNIGDVDVLTLPTRTQKPSYGTNVAFTITNLSALASSATAGWQSVRVSNLSTLATDYLVSVKATMANTAPGNDKAIYVYALPWYTNDAGTTWFCPAQGTTTLPTGSEGTTTIASPNDLRLLGILNYTTQNMVCQNNFLLSNAFGNRMPHGWSLIIINYTGAALATTSGSNNLVEYVPMNDILV